MNRNEIAHLLGCSPRQISFWADQNGLPRKPAKRGHIYDGPACVQWLVAHECAKVTGTDDDGQVINLVLHRTQKLIQEERKLRIQNDVADGHLFPLDVLAAVIAAAFSEVASKLNGIPAELRRRAPQLSAADVDLVLTIVTAARNRVAVDNIDIDKLLNIQPEAS